MRDTGGPPGTGPCPAFAQWSRHAGPAGRSVIVSGRAGRTRRRFTRSAGHGRRFFRRRRRRRSPACDRARLGTHRGEPPAGLGDARYQSRGATGRTAPTTRRATTDSGDGGRKAPEARGITRGDETTSRGPPDTENTEDGNRWTAAGATG